MKISSVAFQTWVDPETWLSCASSILWCSQHRFNSGSQTLRTVLEYKDEWPRLERAYAARGMGARWCWDELCSGNRRKSTFNWVGRGWRRARGIQILLVCLHETYKTYTSCPERNRKRELVRLSRWCYGVVGTVVEGHKQGPYSDGLNCCVTSRYIFSVFYKVGHCQRGLPSSHLYWLLDGLALEVNFSEMDNRVQAALFWRYPPFFLLLFASVQGMGEPGWLLWSLCSLLHRTGWKWRFLYLMCRSGDGAHGCNRPEHRACPAHSQRVLRAVPCGDQISRGSTCVWEDSIMAPAWILARCWPEPALRLLTG